MFWLDTRSAAERRRDELAELRKTEAAGVGAVPWDPGMRWEPALKIHGKSYRQPSLFKVRVSSDSDLNPNVSYNKFRDKFSLSPNRKWAYREVLLPAGTTLETFSGRRRGSICFDSAVKIPMIHENARGEGEPEYWKNPIMSLTPMEHFSLRPGIRAARGRVIIAGLGMGYMLDHVCRKSNVTHVTLVEQSKGILDWIYPKIDTHGKSIDVVVGDAYEIVPTLDADVALIDIFPTYGGNRDEWEMLVRLTRDRASSPSLGTVKKTWIWGA